MSIKKLILMSFVMFVVLLGQAYAVDVPRPLSLDSRIRTIAYEQNNVTNLYCSTFVTTQIIFAKDQQIVDIQSGDADAWTTTVPKALSYILNIKPTIPGSQSDLMVTTMSHSGKTFFYRFFMTSVKAQSANPNKVTYAVQFVYPSIERAKLLSRLNDQRIEKRSILNASVNPKNYNWQYSFNGDRSIMPLHVFDDGKFTYMQLRANKLAPAIFAVNNAEGKETVVNYRKVGNYLVVQQVAPQFTLRAGKYAVASIFNNKMISKCH